MTHANTSRRCAVRALRLLRACVEFVVSGVHGEAHHRAAKNGSGTYRERRPLPRTG